MPVASVSSSVKTDVFCPGAAGPVFCSLSPLFLERSVVGRRWKSGLRESCLRRDGLPVANGVKRDTPPGAQRGGVCS